MFSYFKGALDCIAGFGLIFQSGLRRFVVIPLIINIALFSTALYFLRQQANQWVDKLLPDWLSFLEVVLLPLFYITVLLIVFYSFTLLANLVAAPFNSLLAARVEAKLAGRAVEDVNSDAFWKIVIRSLAAELKKMLYFFKWLIPLLILTVIPVVNVAAPFAWFIFAAWTFALEYTDYPLANRGQLFTEVREYNRKNRMRALGFGSVVFALTSIPVLNFFAMPVAVCGATRLTVKAGGSGNA